MTKLMAQAARYVAEHLGFVYNADEEEGCMAFLKVVHDLPNDAKEVVPGQSRSELVGAAKYKRT